MKVVTTLLVPTNIFLSASALWNYIYINLDDFNLCENRDHII